MCEKVPNPVSNRVCGTCGSFDTFWHFADELKSYCNQSKKMISSDADYINHDDVACEKYWNASIGRIKND